MCLHYGFNDKHHSTGHIRILNHTTSHSLTVFQRHYGTVADTDIPILTFP
jgi:hypothetical protein